MALVQTCKCEECGLQRSFANHWVMIIERKESLTVLPVWDEKKVRRTRHFCGRAHASRYVERWIANPGMALVPDVASEAESNRVTSFSRLQDDRAVEDPDDYEQTRKVEQMLMQDENGEELSYARVIPTPTPEPIPQSSPIYAVQTPPPCVLPPPLAHVPANSFARRMSMTL
jgi:hypothetical protein